MKNTSLYDDILSAIEKLYSNISWRIQQKRIDTYHSEPSVNTVDGGALDIKTPLFKFIDEISRRAPQEVTEVQTLDQANITQLVETQVASNTGNMNPPVSKTQNVDDLTRFFKSTHPNATFQPGISEKLKHSIVEHINASIRYARKGDTAVARMHAEIANTAYQELAHYITDEAHTQFAREIEEQLGVLMPSK